MSDVTRMWPVNGKFSDWQRELYGFYLSCYRAILKAIRPGALPSAIMLEAAGEMDRALSRAKFSKDIYRKAAEAFVKDYRAAAGRPEASLGHWVGMATHDDGPHTGPLKPGMVFTIEPALTIPDERVYIRLEDPVVITATGFEHLSAGLGLGDAGQPGVKHSWIFLQHGDGRGFRVLALVENRAHHLVFGVHREFDL